MTQQTDQLLLIDLSGIAHMVWHVSGEQNDPSYVSRELVRRVRDLASAHPHAAICCDNGKSFRKELDPTYKANRDTDNRAPLYHQMSVACDILKRDGFIVWSVKGYEADDLIATATAQALAIDGTTVLIASSDKDLLQLVNERVTAKSLRDDSKGKVFDAAAVVEKFRVKPEQMLDYLSLLGDKSDNIIGARGIGEVNAAKLLNEHGTLGAVYAKMAQGMVPGMSIGIRTSLQEFKDRWPLVRELITLRTDAPIELSDIAAERTAPPMSEETETMNNEESLNAAAAEMTDVDARAAVADAFASAKQNLAGAVAGGPFPPFSKADIAEQDVRIARHQVLEGALGTAALGNAQEDKAQTARRGDIVPYRQPEPVVDVSQQLEPRSMLDAIKLANLMFESRLYGAYGTAQAVLSTIMAGREIGLPAMASLRAFHIIDSKPTLSADAIRSLVLKSKLATYFRCTERTAEKATFVTKRGDDPEVSLTYTVEEGRQAWSKSSDAWDKSTWGKSPADMVVARASSKLARLVYADVIGGFYAPEEME